MKSNTRYIIILLVLMSKIAAAQTEISVRLVHSGFNVPISIIELAKINDDSAAANIKTYNEKGMSESHRCVSIDRFQYVIDLALDLSATPVVNQVTGKQDVYVVDDGSSFELTLSDGTNSFSMCMKHPQHDCEERGLEQFRAVCYEILKIAGQKPSRFGIKKVRNSNLKRLK